MIELADFRPKSRALYGLTDGSRLSGYLSDRACTNAMVINADEAWRLNDKRMLRKIFGSLTDQIVVTHGYVKDRFYYRQDSNSHLRELLTAGGKLVVKPCEGTSGKSVEVIDPDRWDVAEAMRYISCLDGYVVTGWVEQAGYSSAMWTWAANTVRLLTMRPKGRRPFVAAAVHRIGNERSGVADNWNLGGLCAAIDLASGTLSPAAMQVGEEPPTWHDVHPETGGRIAGVKIPFWGETLDLVFRLAEGLEPIPYVGWDFIITDDGPVLLEANADPGVHGIQVHRGLLEDRRCLDFYRSHGVDGIE